MSEPIHIKLDRSYHDVLVVLRHRTVNNTIHLYVEHLDATDNYNTVHSELLCDMLTPTAESKSNDKWCIYYNSNGFVVVINKKTYELRLLINTYPVDLVNDCLVIPRGRAFTYNSITGTALFNKPEYYHIPSGTVSAEVNLIYSGRVPLGGLEQVTRDMHLFYTSNNGAKDKSLIINKRVNGLFSKIHSIPITESKRDIVSYHTGTKSGQIMQVPVPPPNYLLFDVINYDNNEFIIQTTYGKSAIIRNDRLFIIDSSNMSYITAIHDRSAIVKLLDPVFILPLINIILAY